MPHPPAFELLPGTLPEVRWPPFAASAAANQLAAQFHLERSQWWDPEALGRLQRAQLGVLLRYSARTIPHYRAVIGDCLPGLAAAEGPSGIPDLTWEQFRRLPILTRPDLQAQGEALVSRAVPAGHGRLLRVQSSGSTGTPVGIAKTELCNFYWKVFALRLHLWHGHDLGACFAAIRHTESPAAMAPPGEVLPSWGPGTRDCLQTGPAWLLSTRNDIAVQYDWLRWASPAYLLSYPSNLARLAEYGLDRGLPLPGLRQVLTLGEALPAGLRALCADAWGVGLADAYTAEETGFIALQCPRCEQYHVQSEALVLEVLDQAGAPCAPGTVGRVVVTPLHNFGTPLIRYALGDHAEVGEPCACGRGLPVLRRILGRTRNLARLPDGREFRPSVGFCDLARIPGVRQAQLVQSAPDRVEVRLVCGRTLDAAEAAQVAALIRTNFDWPLKVEISYHAEIPRGPGDKFEDFVRAQAARR
ncbi:phenylacetate--CoA ligase family protein [Candidatus Thiodictyon syntrophicum]|jgi:phenylacetate-CoA ligase|nr:phenylacetate--CoA ligase family protein [Candidatus Thiodictyon syntrophicum]